MRITFCGTGMAELNPERAGASIFVQHNGAGVLLDCGPGSLQKAIGAGVKLEMIQAVLLSHIHFDHMLAVPELLIRFVFNGLMPPSIYGPPESSEILDKASGFALSLLNFPKGRESMDRINGFDVHEISEEELNVRGFWIQSASVPHVSDLHALALRVSIDGRAIVYSGDTKPAPDIMVDLARGADMLIHECYSDSGLKAFVSGLPSDPDRRLLASYGTVHSQVQAVACIAEKAGVPTLALTHLLPTEIEQRLISEATQFYGGTIIVPCDGSTLEI